MAISEIEGSYTDYGYTGSMQSLTIPTDGIYKLEVWGAGGGENGGAGGYSIGYKKLDKGDVVYIGCGQCGERGSYGARFNGGQDGSTESNPAHWYGRHAGGGCTHMALANGELYTLKSNTGAVLIVAGAGGAGKTSSSSDTSTGSGGNGGGLSGASGSSGAGGSRSDGWTFGLGQPATISLSGGGAGWHGGYAGALGGGGGCAYLDGVAEFAFSGVTYTPSTTIGGGGSASANGKARITLVKKAFLPVQVNGTQIEKILFNGTEITGLQFDGTTVF